MSLRNNPTNVELAYEAGLHRCPARFSSTFKDPLVRDLRRRVFYTLYVLDRLLSAEFGIPLMLNDSDVDTCIPGSKERHVEGDSPGHPARSPDSQKRKRSPSVVPEEDTTRRRLLPAMSMVTITGIMGRAMEVFNKSVKHRSLQDALSLRTELEAWWNDIDSGDVSLSC